MCKDKESKPSKIKQQLLHTIRACVAEFIGVTLFVFIGSMSIYGENSTLIQIAAAHGLAIAVLVAACARVR